jgi:hypothetical protein
MAAKKRAAKTGAGVWAAGRAVRHNPYVERLIDDEELRENLRAAVESSRRAYDRIADGRGPQAIMDDKKTQRQLKAAAGSLRDAAEALRGAGRKRRRKRRGAVVMLVVVGAGTAVALNQDLRKKALDLLFGAEEEFEYSSVTSAQSTAPGAGAGGDGDAAGSSAAAEAVGGPPASASPEGPVGTS